MHSIKSPSIRFNFWAILFLLPTFALAQDPAPPNFVIIMADDMGYNGTSVFDGWLKTPNLERLANQGMKFSDFHSSGVVCSPTRAGLMTGRYQERAGIPGVVFAAPDKAEHYTGLQTSEVTFPKQLAKVGYTSALMGKWHLGYYKKYNPLHHGFNTFRGFVSGNVDYISHYDQAGAYDWWDGLEQVQEEGYSTHLINKHSIEFIKTNKDRPFCLYVAHEAVHSPMQGPMSQIERGPLAGKRTDAVELTEEEAFTQMMHAMDQGIGEIIDTLDELNLSDNTLVLFFSDNGHAFNGPNSFQPVLRGRKVKVWEGGHRVPAIARWPGKIKANTTNSGLFISLDIMPTLMELAQAPVPRNHAFDGTSMKDSLFSGAQSTDRQLFWLGKAMREGNWKWVAGADGGLFDLSNDIAEQHDLSAKYPERVKAMQLALAAWKVDVAHNATPQPSPPEGVEIVKRKKKSNK